MTWNEAGQLRDRARHAGVAADRMGLPPRNSEWTCRQPESTVVFWLNGRDFEFANKLQADDWLNSLLGKGIKDGLAVRE